MLASPSDVSSERAATEQVINRLNRTAAPLINVRLELVCWETHSWPDFADDAQDAINGQLPDDVDYFVGILWGRFGTPTGRYGSGTEEEFSRALERRQSGRDLKIMMYFKDAPIKPSAIDLAQLERVRAFRARVEAEGGYLWSFADRFAELLEIHLSLQLKAYHESRTLAPASDSIAVTSAVDVPPQKEGPNAPKDHLLNVADVLSRIDVALADLTGRLENRTAELNTEECQGNRPLIDTILNIVAVDLSQFVALMEANIPIFVSEFEDGIQAFTESLGTVQVLDQTTDWSSLVSSLTVVTNNIKLARTAFSRIKVAAASVPRFTPQIRRATRRTIAVVDRVMSEFASVQMLLEEVTIALSTGLAKSVG